MSLSWVSRHRPHRTILSLVCRSHFPEWVSDLQKSCEVAVVEVFEEGVDVELGVDLGHVEVEPGPQTFGEAQVIFLQDLETTKKSFCGVSPLGLYHKTIFRPLS